MIRWAFGLSKSTKDPQLAEDFYIALQNTVNSVPNRHILFIGADTNAQIGTGFINFQDSVGQFGKGFLNANGERLGNFLSRNDLIATNTFFQHKLKHRVTWIHPDSNPQFIDRRSGQPRRNPIRNQIDFIVTKAEIKTEILDSRSYHGTLLDSDHKIVICKCELNLPRIYKEKKNNQIKLDVNKLQNESLRQKFQEEVCENLFNSPEEKWADVVNAVKSSGEKVLGKQERKKQKQTNEIITQLSIKQWNLKIQVENSQNPERRKLLQKERNKTKKQLKKELKLEKEKEQIRRIEDIEKQKK